MNVQEFFDSLSELDPSNVGMWPSAVKTSIWALAFFLTLFFTYQMTLSDALTELQSKRAQEKTMLADYEKHAYQSINLSRLKKQYADMQLSFGALVKQLPSDTEVPALLEDISQLGVDNGLEFESIDLGDEKIVEFYAELPIKITVTGGYHSLANFVSGIAALPRIVTLHDFSLEPENQKDTSGALKMTILAKTYRYNERK